MKEIKYEETFDKQIPVSKIKGRTAKVFTLDEVLKEKETTGVTITGTPGAFSATDKDFELCRKKIIEACKKYDIPTLIFSERVIEEIIESLIDTDTISGFKTISPVALYLGGCICCFKEKGTYETLCSAFGPEDTYIGIPDVRNLQCYTSYIIDLAERARHEMEVATIDKELKEVPKFIPKFFLLP